MLDSFGRKIRYLRLSITDRCNLRCRYCMPDEGVPLTAHDDLLRYEELLRVAEAAVSLGIDRFKVTGGEPLVRRGCTGFIHALKALPGVRQVTLTTNGLLLPPLLDELRAAGLDGVNISLDTLDNVQYQRLTRRTHTADEVLHAVRLCAARLPTKINAVLLPETADQLIPLAELAQTLPVDVRFIERMPLGTAQTGQTTIADVALDRLRVHWPQLKPVIEPRGNGPARYFRAQGMQGCIGLIDAVSHGFCDRCNRLRLTSTGLLKPCLCYEQGVELRPLLRDGADNTTLQSAIRAAILQKPAAHCFQQRENITEHKSMNQIGG
ncbi:GTP 3',8-cyclase MoaA [Candidatus Agathobaculum pullicola]|uniref:GTP 3',8-cyclase MoaA n=1 Tax=Candidatus Agathobaculum pullicola TaxID=2838426 RepID=UPI003F903A95